MKGSSIGFRADQTSGSKGPWAGFERGRPGRSGERSGRSRSELPRRYTSRMGPRYQRKCPGRARHVSNTAEGSSTSSFKCRGARHPRRPSDVLLPWRISISSPGFLDGKHPSMCFRRGYQSSETPETGGCCISSRTRNGRTHMRPAEIHRARTDFRTCQVGCVLSASWENQRRPSMCTRPKPGRNNSHDLFSPSASQCKVGQFR